MIYEIAVHGDTILIHPEVHPFWLYIHQSITFLKEKNVGSYFCTGILFKSCIRQADRSE